TAMLEVWCLVNGKSSSEAFPVDVDASTTVGRLKDAIKKKFPECKDAAHRLTLWPETISWKPPRTITFNVPPLEATFYDPKASLESCWKEVAIKA
ncbi:hypothetical protein BGX34_010970, partial [Mortierella sp. NVP85]